MHISLLNIGEISQNSKSKYARETDVDIREVAYLPVQNAC